MSSQLFIDTYPALFSNRPQCIWTNIPTGWHPLIHEFCRLILTACSPDQANVFEFEEISADQGFLLLRYKLPPSLDASRIEAIDARSFAIGSRSQVSCVTCGRMISRFPAVGQPLLCDECFSQ